ncbi:acetyl-CoA carboxylase carboxyl transferase subunit alpha [Enterococcus nangangensis]|uniref:acetyl-CoA carboxylase carboxyl transferase subunit alpha n=1 Tax=Enterococcus nangangensis TaxID=2559926 RepID=UPI0010F9FD86|nr:acetyl-CoA carboxylase carboxyl transferase subunit alpha [Enterococcus nangangensis]
MVKVDSGELLKKARAATKTTSRAYFASIFRDFQELHGDRLFADDQAVTGGLAFLGEQAVTVIGLQKGRNLKENLQTNFGQAHPEGYRKALRLMRQAEKFQRPIITFINTAGAYCGIGAEERGQGSAIAENLMFLSDCRVPVIAIIIGEGGSGGALALALADEVWMLEHTFYAILSPEGFASILWKDASLAKKAAEVMKISPQELLQLGVCERIIPETDAKGAALSEKLIAQRLQNDLSAKLTQLQSQSTAELLANRYQRFRKF